MVGLEKSQGSGGSKGETRRKEMVLDGYELGSASQEPAVGDRGWGVGGGPHGAWEHNCPICRPWTQGQHQEGPARRSPFSTSSTGRDGSMRSGDLSPTVFSRKGRAGQRQVADTW